MDKRKGICALDFVTGLRFLGYDSSGTTIDPKGVLRLAETSTGGRFDRDIMFSNILERFSGDYFLPSRDKSYFKQPREHRVGRTNLDAEVITLAEAIQNMNFKLFINDDLKTKRRFNMLRDAQQQVDNSMEDPRVYRETMGRLVSNPKIDGIEFSVDLAWTQHQIGEGTSPYFLKGHEYIATKVGEDRKVLANRYFKDSRVVIAGRFEGDVRRPQNYSAEFDNESKGRLTKLFGQIVSDIDEVIFPDSTRFKAH